MPAEPIKPTPRMQVPPEGNGWRVDRLLAMLVPALGLRGRRRLCEAGRVLLDGRPAGAAARARAGQELSLAPLSGAEAPLAVSAGNPYPEAVARLVGKAGGLAALYKPAGLHSAMLAGGGGPSLEAALASLTGVGDSAGASGQGEGAFPRLLNRLDAGTSGLVLAALDAGGERIWRVAQAEGTVDKRYLALVVGHPPRDFIVRAALDMSRRVRVRPLEHDADPLRHTEVRVLARFTRADVPKIGGPAVQHPAPNAGPYGDRKPDGALALVGCRIRRGARHQIRAHLALAGYPLWGDDLYGAGGGMFFLHHGLCRLPGFQALCLPVWEAFLPSVAVTAARAYLQGREPFMK